MTNEFNRAMQMLSDGKAQQAIALFENLITHQPENCELLNGLAYAYFHNEQNEKALELFKKVTSLQPQSANAWLNLAGIYLEDEQYHLAENYFEKALKLDENLGQAWHFLCVALFKQKKYPELAQRQNKVSQFDPFAALVTQAQQAMSSNQANEAQQFCQQILSRYKRHPQALYLLAMLNAQQGKLEQALEYIESALSYSPYNEQLRNFQSQLYVQMRFYTPALVASQLLVEQQPSDASYWLLHADNLVNTGQYQAALNAYGKAQALQPTNNAILLQKAHIYKAQGENELAIAAYRNCLQEPTTVGSAYWALANLSATQLTTHDLAAIKQLQLDPDLSPEQACQATFALAKYHEDNKDYQLAFTTYQSANINRSGINFNPNKYTQKIQAIIKTFDSESVTLKAPERPTDVTPIFIVGLPRSGSTLVEQILASHSQVEGTMELKTLPAIARQVFLKSIAKNHNSSGRLDKFTAEELADFGERYINESQIYRSNSRYFIDKLPPNFQHIGLIKKILPHAIIIDVRRQPMACGFGIYKQYFGNGHDFSYDLQHIALYYQQYLLLMDHWQQVLPNEIFFCQYENLVSNTEQVIKELLNFCGLPFEDNCLRFYENQRAVRTASSDQVRKPINQKGVELWKNYRQALAPLKQALGEDIIKNYSQYISS